MNIFFMDYRYVRHDAWRYIVSVLKIKKVYCFSESDQFPYGTFGTADVNFRNQSPDSRKDIVYSIANQMKRGVTASNGEFVGHEDLDLYKESHWNKPKTNVKETNDPNILILGAVYSQFRGSSFFEHLVYLTDEDYIVMPNKEDDYYEARDVAINMVLYLHKILKKQLGTDKYEKRLCFYMIDPIKARDYYMCKGFWREVRERKYNYIGFINTELSKQYPNIFPVTELNGKRYYSSIYDIDIIKEAHRKWVKDCEEFIEEERKEWERERAEADNNAYDWDKYVRELNREFWNECGEAGSNCESGPGWG